MTFRASFLTLLASAAPVLAQSTETVPGAAKGAAAHKSSDFFDLFVQGGVAMYPLAVLSIIGVSLIIIYMITIRRGAVVSDRFMNAAEAMIRKRDYLGLVAYCHRHNECIARVTQKTLDFMTKNTTTTFEEVREVAETEGSRQAGMLSSRITYLADIGSIAPMIGLLGTVLGMIKSFAHISSSGIDSARQEMLAQGVSEALIATAAGLFVGIPALGAYSLFRARVQKYTAELESAATHLLAMIHSQVKRGGRAPAMADEDEDFASPALSKVRSSGKSPLDDRPDLHGI